MDKPHLHSVRRDETSEPDSARTELHGIGNGGGGGRWYELERRLIVLETHFQYVATKEDIANLQRDIEKAKLWLVITAISAGISLMVMLIGIIGLAIRFLL